MTGGLERWRRWAERTASGCPGFRRQPGATYACDYRPEAIREWFRTGRITVRRAAAHVATRSRSRRASHRQRSQRRVASRSSSRGDPSPDSPDPPPRGRLGEPARQHSPRQARRPKRPSLYIAPPLAQVQGRPRVQP